MTAQPIPMICTIFKGYKYCWRLENAEAGKPPKHVCPPPIVCPSIPTLAELIAELSVGMTDAQKAQFWYETCYQAFELLGKVDAPIIPITSKQWIDTAKAQYPSLANLRLPDGVFKTTNYQGVRDILSKDWSNLVPYIPETGDCDDFDIRLYNHLCDYYGINAGLPIWGDTDKGYHGFILIVYFDGESLVARLIEPQTDEIFINRGPLGLYVPRELSDRLGKIKL